MRTRSPLSSTSRRYTLTPPASAASARAPRRSAPARSRSRPGRSSPRRRRGRRRGSSYCELEALRAQACRADADLHGLAEDDGRAEVDLGAGEDHVAQGHLLLLTAAEPGEPRLLEVRREDRVVDVAEAVEVAEANGLAVHEREPLHRARWYRRRCGRRADEARDRIAARVAGAGTGGAAVPRRGAAPLHRLRHVVPRGVDGGRGGASPRARSGCRRGLRPRARGGPARDRLPRGRDAAHARGGPRLARPEVARHRNAGEPDGRALRRGRRLYARDRGELVPHGELHLRGRRARGAPGRGRLAGFRTRSRRSSRRRRRGSARRSGSSSPGRAATCRPRTRPC